MAEPGDDFYVGWAETVPAREARVVRRAVAVLCTLAVAVPLTILLAQARLAPASFEFGEARRFRGTLVERPVPALLVARPGTAADGGVTSLLLVAPGKHGAAELVRGRDGEQVELTGTLVYRDGRTMIEVEPGSLAGSPGPAHQASIEDLGTVRLRGEIVDTKCHLGVMNPGDGKTHRGCAARCVSGGIPPALRVRDATGAERLFLLVGPAGEPVNQVVRDLVAEPVEVTGRAERRDDLLVLYADPGAIRRIGEEG